MSKTKTNIWTCDHPDCKMWVASKKCPEDWYVFNQSFRPVVACPSHKDEAIKCGHEVHSYLCRKIDAINKWTEENPGPDVPPWLNKLWAME